MQHDNHVLAVYYQLVLISQNQLMQMDKIKYHDLYTVIIVIIIMTIHIYAHKHK